MAITCFNCHFAGNPNNAERCQQCDTLLRSAEHPKRPAEHQPQRANTATGPHSSDGSCKTEPSTISNEGQHIITVPDNQLSGRITWTETTTEHIDFNYYRFFSQLILFFMFLPFLVVIFSISFILWISFAILGFSSLSHDVSPFNIANTINAVGVLVAITFPRIQQANQVPAVRLTLQSEEGERPALIKGELASGTFRRGDQIELTGVWRQGTLFVESGYNQTLQTAISIRGDYWRFVFVGLLVILALTFLVTSR